MKKKKTTKKLLLKRETIRALTKTDLGQVGGASIPHSNASTVSMNTTNRVD